MKTFKDIKKEIKQITDDVKKMHILYDLDEDYADLTIEGEEIDLLEGDSVDLAKLKRLQATLIRNYGSSVVGEMEESNC